MYDGLYKNQAAPGECHNTPAFWLSTACPAGTNRQLAFSAGIDSL